MALTSMNPIRLADAHLMCAGEFLIDPVAQPTRFGDPEKELSWLSALPFAFTAAGPAVPEAQVATSLVIASVPGGVRTGLVLRLRMLDPHATPAQCEAVREDRMTDYADILREHGLAPSRPIAGEGVYALLPREGLHFLRRARTPDDTPIHASTPITISLTLLEKLVGTNPHCGLCITFLPHGSAQETEGADFIVGSWGFPEGSLGALEILKLPLTACPEAAPEDTLTGFHFLYDPWEQLGRIRRKTGSPALTAIDRDEMQCIFGPYTPPKPASPAPASPETPMHGMGRATRQLTQGLRESIPDMRGQMKDTIRQMRQGVQERTLQAVDGLVESVQKQLGAVTANLRDLPGQQRLGVMDVLERMDARMESLPDVVSKMRKAGLTRPIDTLTLMKMGFSSEQELIDLGLAGDLLDSLRATISLRQQCPRDCGSDVNCMTYSMMIGYMYEALINEFFVPLFRATGGYKKAHHLGDYTKVNADHCERLAAFGQHRDLTIRRLTEKDWAAWLTVCNAVRWLRNRQHSDNGAGFLSYDEMSALFDVFLFPGQMAKQTLLRLPAYSSTPPAYAREFKPDLPMEWGETPEAQRDAIRRHIASRTAAFTPSLLQFLIRCSQFD